MNLAETLTTAHLKPSATLAINTRVNELLAQGTKIYHMGFGEARFPVHPKILQALHDHARVRSYLPVPGLPELRTTAAAYYRREFGLDAAASRIIVGPGSKSLLFAVMQVFNGDVLLPVPAWVSYEPQARLAGKGVFHIQTEQANDYVLTPAALHSGLAQARQAGQNPRLLVLNSPNNPTGVMYAPDLLAELAEIARRENLLVLSDEIYAKTAYGDVPHTSIARFYPEGTVVTGGLSKHLSLGGWRLGLALMPPGQLGQQLLEAIGVVAGAIWTTVAAPVQYAATVAYSDDPDIASYVATCTAIHGQVTGFLHRTLTEAGLPCPRPSGGFYLYPSFAPWREALERRHRVTNSIELANLLLNEEHIATLPGPDFGDAPQNLTLRLSTSYLYALDDGDAEAVLKVYETTAGAADFLPQACPRVIEVAGQWRAFAQGLA